MANQGRMPSSHNHRHSGPGVMHHDPYGSSIRPPPGGFPPLFLSPEVMEHKLSMQHSEITKLAKENQRLAVSHETLRQDIGTVNKELQLIHSHVGEVKSEEEHQRKGIMDKISMLEGELKSAEGVKMELQKVHTEAQSLVSTRQELISNVQRLTRDLQMAHGDAQQIPVLMTELDGLRQEYQHARGTYEYEKKLYSEHLESLQVMEKNYMEMSREMEKLRAELTNFDPRAGQYSGYSGYGDTYHMGNYASGQNAYPVAQGQAPFQGAVMSGKAAGGPTGIRGNSPHVAGQSAPTGSGVPLEASKVPGPSAATGISHDAQKGRTGASYGAQRPNGPSYDAGRGPVRPGYDPFQMGPTGAGYGAHTGTGHDVQRRGGHDMQKGPRYDQSSNTGYVRPQGHVPATTFASKAPNSGSGNPPPR